MELKLTINQDLMVTRAKRRRESRDASPNVAAGHLSRLR
jgi:hypothetical protein